jgi:hypothetical protein
MHKDKWVFYTDLFGSQRWEKLDTAGLVVAESSVSFDTLAAAVADASRSGYVAGDGSMAGALEWRREAVAPLPEHEHSGTGE